MRERQWGTPSRESGCFCGWRLPRPFVPRNDIDNYCMSLRARRHLRPQPKMLVKRTRGCAFAAVKCSSGLLAMLLALTLSVDVHARDHYVSPVGDDSNPGTQAQPWRSIAKVNATDLAPGDHICFEAGNSFAGTIELDQQDSGTAGTKLVVTSYGKGRAVINGGNGSGLGGHDWHQGGAGGPQL